MEFRFNFSYGDASGRGSSAPANDRFGEAGTGTSQVRLKKVLFSKAAIRARSYNDERILDQALEGLARDLGLED